MRKHSLSILALGLALSATLSVGANAADYSFSGTDGTDYYTSSSYEDVYGSQYNYGGRNVVDYQIPEPEYGVFSTTQTGVMEKTSLPGLQQYVGGEANGGYGIVESAAPEQPGVTQSPMNGSGDNFTVIGTKKAFTKLTESFKLSNGAVGKLSIPAIGIKNYYLCEGETSLHELLRVGWKCLRMRPQPRCKLFHRRDQGPKARRHHHLHNLCRHAQLFRDDGCQNQQ